MNRKTGRMFFTGKRKCFTGAPHDDETAAAFPAVRLQKAGQRLAQGRIVLCGEYSSTLRQVLECFPQGTIRPCARRSVPSRGRRGRNAAGIKGKRRGERGCTLEEKPLFLQGGKDRTVFGTDDPVVGVHPVAAPVVALRGGAEVLGVASAEKAFVEEAGGEE